LPRCTLFPYTPLFRSSIVDRERKQLVARADDDELPAAEHVGNRRVALFIRQLCVPQRCPCGRVERNEIVAAVAGKQQLPRRAQQDRKSTRLNSSHVSI